MDNYIDVVMPNEERDMKKKKKEYTVTVETYIVAEDEGKAERWVDRMLMPYQEYDTIINFSVLRSVESKEPYSYD